MADGCKEVKYSIYYKMQRNFSMNNNGGLKGHSGAD